MPTQHTTSPSKNSWQFAQLIALWFGVRLRVSYQAKYDRCPALGADAAGYLDFMLTRLGQSRYDVLLPVHEQAFLFASVQDQLRPKTGLALTDFEHFALEIISRQLSRPAMSVGSVGMLSP